MANESIIDRSSFEVCNASNAVVDGDFSTGTRTAIADITGITGNQKDYPLLDFKFKNTSGTPTENGKINIFRIPSDGTDQSPVPAGSYKQHRVCAITLDNSTPTKAYYHYGAMNVDQNDEFIWENDDGSVTLTGELSVRTRALKPGI